MVDVDQQLFVECAETAASSVASEFVGIDRLGCASPKADWRDLSLGMWA